METINGMRVIVNAHIMAVPRMQVTQEFARLQSPELVAETNRWMRAFFGTYYPTYLVDTGLLGLRSGEAVVMHPERFAELRIAAAKIGASHE